MALTAAEEAQLRDLIAQQSALLSLAGVEATILSKLGATKVTLSDLPSATAINDADLLLLRQGTTDKSVTGLTFKGLIPTVPDASETVKGIVEKATAAEAQAFAADKYIDGERLASALQGANQSLAASGYQKLPGGLIFQWGKVASGSGTGNSDAVTFPITFPNAAINVSLTIQNIAAGSTAGLDLAVLEETLSTTGFTFSRRSQVASTTGGNTYPTFWIAIGY